MRPGPRDLAAGALSRDGGAPSPGPPESGAAWARALLGYVALALGLGALLGVLWWRVVDLPGYRVAPDGRAATSERGLASFIAGDAWFALLGVFGGVALGVLAWRRLRLVGWPVVLVAAGGALAAALVCWWVGTELGPGDFTARLAAARPGDLVLIELTLRAPVALLVWPFAATVPVLLGSSLGPDDEEPRPLFTHPLFTPPLAQRAWVARLRRRFKSRSGPGSPP